MLCASSSCRRDLTEQPGPAFLDDKGHIFCTNCSDTFPSIVCEKCNAPIHGPMSRTVFLHPLIGSAEVDTVRGEGLHTMEVLEDLLQATDELGLHLYEDIGELERFETLAIRLRNRLCEVEASGKVAIDMVVKKMESQNLTNESYMRILERLGQERTALRRKKRLQH
ncbi:hypothetical protein BD410DRAFT_791375 [Rickenella mellea]|uniref:Uncharacterized protein n=1 Tax=Rickenella mellea TaxID=50990 RepID=A0A4Y7PYB5_9AGAM|nr:hypothetical protein BD410DRAFT_791375 [Rickenella mellea]